MSRVEILTGPERRRRWSDEEKRRIVQATSVAGASVAEVARVHDVSRQQIYHWRRVLGAARRTCAAAVDFVPVALASGPEALGPGERPPPAGEMQIEIALAGGRILRAPASLPGAVLKRVIRVVEGA